MIDRRVVLGIPFAGDNSTVEPVVSSPRTSISNPFQTPGTPNVPTGLDLNPFAEGGEIWVIADWEPGTINSAGSVVQWAIEALKDGETIPLVFHPDATAAPPFRIPNLEPNTEYHVSVRAITSDGGSSTPLQGDVTTGYDTSSPPTPQNVAGARTYKGLVAKWDLIGSVLAPFTGQYEVQIATDSGFTTGVESKNTGTAAVVSWGNLTPEITYWVRVRAISSSGVTGSYSTATSLNVGGVVAADITAGTIGADVGYIGDLTAEQITTGDLNASGTVNIQNLNATNITSSGTLNFAVLKGGSLGAYLIELQSGGTIRSANWVNLSAGWMMDGAGNLQANTIVARGSIITTSGTLSIQIGSVGVNEITFNATGQSAAGYIQHGTSGYLSIQAPTESGFDPGVINFLNDTLSLEVDGSNLVCKPAHTDCFKDFFINDGAALRGDFDGTNAAPIAARGGSNVITFSIDGSNRVHIWVDTTDKGYLTFT